MNLKEKQAQVKILEHLKSRLCPMCIKKRGIDEINILIDILKKEIKRKNDE